MIESLIWLAFVGLLSLCEEFADLGQGFWPRHSRSAHGLWGDIPVYRGAALFRQARF